MKIKGLSEEDMKKANGLWKMLDDMYEADPEEYKKFIEKQMKEVGKPALSYLANRVTPTSTTQTWE